MHAIYWTKVLVGCMLVGRAVRQFQPGMLFEVRGDLAGVANAVVIADHHDHRGPRERPEHLVQQGDEARRAAAAQPGTPTPRCSGIGSARLRSVVLSEPRPNTKVY